MAEEKKEVQPPQEFTAPDWLNVTLIQKALQNEGDNRQVANLSVGPATAAGDNYASSIYRAKVKLSDGEEKSFIIKAPATGKATMDFSKILNIFGREAFMLAENIPKMQALLEDAAPGRFRPLAPRCPLYGDSPVDHIVMEDLAPAGFKMADRKQGLGLRHAVLALRALARFHAASHALLQREPRIAERLPSVWKALKDMLGPMVGMGLQGFALALRSWPGYEQYAHRLEQLLPGAMDRVIALCDPKPGAFNVLVHGDFWVNNMMFRYEDGYVVDAMLIDFPACTVMSPAVDLIYVLSTSTSEDVSAHHQDLLVREYHFALDEAATLLGVKAPSLKELLADIDAHGILCLMGTMNVVNFVKAEQAMDMEAVLAGEMPTAAKMFENPAIKKWLQRVIPEYARKGWLGN